MNNTASVSAQLVMKRADGRSILDLQGPTTAASPDLTAGDLPVDRIDRIRAMLAELGFTVAEGNRNTLSVLAPRAIFEEVFGMDPEAALASGSAAHATRIPPELAPFVADVFVTPGPTFFP